MFQLLRPSSPNSGRELLVLSALLTSPEFGLFGPDWPISGHVFIPEPIPAAGGWALLIGSA